MRSVYQVYLGLGVLSMTAGCISNRCDEVDALPSADAVAIGDSILAWNASKCQSVIDSASRSLGARIDNRSVNGARLRGGIPGQRDGSDARLVIVDGGGNDLNGADACKNDPTAELDRLASLDGTEGAMPALVDGLVGEGHDVLLLGYYGVKRGGWYGLGACGEEVALLKERYAMLASRHPEVVYVDLEETVTSDQAEHYAFDAVHPSPKGAEVLGEAVAAALRDLGL